MSLGIIHQLAAEVTIPVPSTVAWDFFSSPLNLREITPPELDFVVKSQVPEKIHPGLMIEYRVRPLFGIPLPWLTEITHVREPYYFVDEQRLGPYRIWHHEHFLEPIGPEATRVRDLVHYVLPFSPLGDVIHPVLVAPQLKRIFDYRKQKLLKIFSAA